MRADLRAIETEGGDLAVPAIFGDRDFFLLQIDDGIAFGVEGYDGEFDESGFGSKRRDLFYPLRRIEDADGKAREEGAGIHCRHQSSVRYRMPARFRIEQLMTGYDKISAEYRMLRFTL